jgi:hypothetical protein
VAPVARFVLQPDGTYQSNRDDLPPSARVTMPADWSATLGPDFLGRVQYSRKFNKPTGLYLGERVFLVVEPQRSEASVTWKGDPLGFVCPGGPAGRFDITERLEDYNEVVIMVDHPVLQQMRSTVGDPTQLPPGGLVGEVRLEIEE